MEKYLKKMNVMNQYDMSRPGVGRAPQRVSTYKDVTAILKSTDFQSSYAERAKKIIDTKG
jgi:hypothetical protein